MSVLRSKSKFLRVNLAVVSKSKNQIKVIGRTGPVGMSVYSRRDNPIFLAAQCRAPVVERGKSDGKKVHWSEGACGKPRDQREHGIRLGFYGRLPHLKFGKLVKFDLKKIDSLTDRLIVETNKELAL